jgi:hypothetical protein
VCVDLCWLGLIVIIGFSSCSSDSLKEHSINSDQKSNSYLAECNKRLEKYSAKFDSSNTIFVKEDNNTTSRYFIERDTHSEMYQRYIRNRTLSAEDSLEIVQTALKLEFTKTKKGIGTKPKSFPSIWVPVQLYRSHYYLYYPSDMMNTPYYQFVGDSAFVKLGGMWDVQRMVDFKSLPDSRYIFKTIVHVYSDSSYIQEIENRITIIDPKNQLALWEYYIWGEKKSEIMIPLERIRAYPMIVNFQSCSKYPFEFHGFDN